MLKAFVGIASDQGLAVFHPERDETMSYVERAVRAGRNSVCFRAVLDDAEARCVQVLCAGGRRREAMVFLDRAAREMGRILPDTPTVSLH